MRTRNMVWKELPARRAVMPATRCGGAGGTALAARWRQLLPTLWQASRDADEEVRDTASHTLVEMGPAALPFLRELLRHPDAEAREHAASLLGLLGRHGQEAIPGLLEALRDRHVVVRRAAAHALRHLVNEEPGRLQVVG